MRITRFVATFYYGPLFTKAHQRPRWSWFQNLALPLDAVRPGASFCASLSLVLLVWKTGGNSAWQIACEVSGRSHTRSLPGPHLAHGRFLIANG